MMGIGWILHTHKSFSYCWCERIIHKVRTVLQTYGFHHTLHTHFFFTDWVHAPVPVAPLFWLPPIYQNLVVDKAFACHFLGLLQSHDVENGRSHVG